MTPAIRALEKARVTHTLHRYELRGDEPGTYGEAVAAAIGFTPERVYKTLVVELQPKELVVAIVPTSSTLDLRALASVAGAKSAAMANPDDAEKATGYVTGGISPFGQKRRLRAFVDAGALALPTLCVSAGRRGLQLEIAPAALLGPAGAAPATIAR